MRFNDFSEGNNGPSPIQNRVVFGEGVRIITNHPPYDWSAEPTPFDWAVSAPEYTDETADESQIRRGRDPRPIGRIALPSIPERRGTGDGRIVGYLQQNPQHNATPGLNP